MRANANPTPLAKGKGHLLASGAITAAIAALACGGTAYAQVAANPVYVQVGAGTTVDSTTVPNTTTVTLGGLNSQSIINWVPTDVAPTGGAIDVLPTGNTWNFIGEGDYVVLNRFTNGAGDSLARQIAISGTVNSSNVLTSATQRGSIWFYNAGGLLINSGAAINVGSLILTSSDINSSNGLIDDGGMINFYQATPGTSGVTIAPGATINVATPLDPGSAYLAVVAPRIRQGGTVRVDGAAAYVAAEEAGIRINNGLFDIDVVVGADGGQALVHDGSTTGPAHQQGDTDQSRIYMVAIPKNDAVSMLVSGQVGYDDALTAQADPDGAVILSGGYGIASGQIAAAAGSSGTADIALANLRLRSDTQAHASGAFTGTPTGIVSSGSLTEGQIFVEGDAFFRGDTSAALTLGADQLVHVTGSMNSSGDLTIESRGGSASVQVDGGQFLVRGALLVSADAGDGSINDPDGADAQAGTASIRLSGGEISANLITASAVGRGGLGTLGDDLVPATPLPGGDGGDGRGGTARIDIEGTAEVTTNGIAAYAVGQGGGGGDFQSGFNISGAPGSGGEGRGGTASVTVTGGTVTTAGVIADASGFGGEGGAFYSFGSGTNTGGGVGGRGGDGRGGTATLDLHTPIATSSQMDVAAQGMGGSGGMHDSGGDGGNAFGGVAQAMITGFDAGYRPFTLDAQAEGGNGGNGMDGTGGNGGDAVGGTARAQTNNSGGRIVVAASTFGTQAFGGSGGDGGLSPWAVDVAVAPSGGRGGSGMGGTVEVVATNGGASLIGAENSSPGAYLSSLGFGGSGGAGAANFSGAGGIGGDGGDSGAGNGGTVRLIANGGTVSRGTGPFLIAVDGVTGFTGAAGNGSGGMGAVGAGSTVAAGHVLIEANNSSAAATVELGTATIDADGDTAGRVVFRGNGTIRAESLDIRTRGTAAPSGNDVSTAAAGIFFAPTGTGSIATTAGGMQLVSGGSIGIHAQGGATVVSAGPTTLEADDQIDIRHASRTGTAATLRSADTLSIQAGTRISAALDSLLSAGTTLALTTTGTDSAIAVNRLDAANITIDATGAAAVEQAQATGDFSIDAASVRMGLAAIGGDIVVTTPGAIDLGSATAGGRVSASGLAIAFTSIDADTSVELTASGAGGVAGGTIDAASIAITANGGAASIDHAEATGNFTASAASFRTGLNSIITGGDIVITSPGAVDLGNSSAGGLVSVNGLSIVFNSIVAGTTLGLTANGPDGIAGGSLDAGGDILLNASRIALTGPVTGDASLFAYATGGTVGIDQSQVAGNIGIFAGGDIMGHYIAGGDVTLDSGASITAAAAANGGYVDANGVASNGNLFVSGAGNVTLASASAARMVGVRAGQAASIAGGSAGEDLLLIAGTTAGLTGFTAGDDIRVEAPGTVTALNVRTTGAGADTANIQLSPSSGFAIVTAAADGADILLTSTGGAIGGGSVSAAGDLTGSAATGIAGGAFAAAGNLTLTAGTAIGLTSAAGGTVALTGATGVTAGSVTSGGATTLISGGGAVTIDMLSSAGNVVASADAVRVADGGDLIFSSLIADTGDAVVHTSGDLTVTSGVVAGLADLSSDGDALTVTSLAAADAALGAANGAMTLGDIAVTNALDANAAGSLAIGGAVTGQTIALTSGDIVIGGTGRVSTAGSTPSIRIANGNDARQTFVGGTGTRGGYHIDADELTRLYGRSIAIVGAGFSGGPDVVVDDFTLAGGTAGSNLGADGTLTIRASGDMRVQGDVALTGLSDANGLTLSARDNIEILLGQGSVRLSNATEAPGGRLRIEGHQIAVATPQAIADIASAPNLDAIEARLAQNDGILLDEGSLFARGIGFYGDVYVQNSGGGTAYAQRRGLTFGAGGLDVSADDAARIVLNGVHLGPDGRVVGLDAIPLLTIRGGPANAAALYFDARSTFNGCLIANVPACIGAANGTAGFPIQNVIEEKDGIEGDKSDEGDGITLPTALITLRELNPLTGEPLVDDPVTGAGNDDLWTPPGE